MDTMFHYLHVNSKSMGHAMFRWTGQFWHQITKWYVYEGNMKRFNEEIANEPCYYIIKE